MSEPEDSWRQGKDSDCSNHGSHARSTWSRPACAIVARAQAIIRTISRRGRGGETRCSTWPRRVWSCGKLMLSIFVGRDDLAPAKHGARGRPSLLITATCYESEPSFFSRPRTSPFLPLRLTPGGSI